MNNHPRRRSRIAAFAYALPGIALAAAPCLTFGQDTAGNAASYPSRLVQLVLPYPPGGGGDVVARLLGKKTQ